MLVRWTAINKWYMQQIFGNSFFLAQKIFLSEIYLYYNKKLIFFFRLLQQRFHVWCTKFKQQKPLSWFENPELTIFSANDWTTNVPPILQDYHTICIFLCYAACLLPSPWSRIIALCKGLAMCICLYIYSF